MSDSIDMNKAEELARRLSQELGFQFKELGGYYQIKAANGHRINIQRGKTLRYIDTSLDVLGQEGTLPLKNGPGSLGAIKAVIEPSLENLERFTRMLGEAAQPAKKASGPRPFTNRSAPAPRQPKPVASAPAQAGASKAPDDGRPAELIARLDKLKERQRLAKIRRLMEEKGFDEATATAIFDGRVNEEDVQVHDETRGLLRDGVVEVEQ